MLFYSLNIAAVVTVDAYYGSIFDLNVLVSDLY